ncbi:MAG: protein kinase [Myxococcota bacterium]
MTDPGQCLDEDTLQAWVDGTLPAADKARAQAHIEACEVCFSAVAEVHALVGDQQAHDTRRYVLGVELGRGGMGVVYRARDQLLDRDVAVKVLHGGWDDPGLRERLLEESTAMARLRHPNIVAVHDVVLDGDDAFVVMELVDGQTLRLWSEAAKPGFDAVLDMFEQIGEGLAAAHEAGVVHRDFKPDNVLIGARRRPQIVDFGIASTLRSDAPFAGTKGYIAPEVEAGRGANARADQYAFCVSLWEVLFGGLPGTAEAPRVQGRVRRVLEQGLAPNPSARFEDLPSLLAALRRARRSRRPWAVLAAAGVAGSVAAGLLWSPPQPSCPPLHVESLSEGTLAAMTDALRKRDGLRGGLLAKQAQDDVEHITARLQDAAEEVCNATTEAPSVRASARACIEDSAAQLSFILTRADQGDFAPLPELLKLPNPEFCMTDAKMRTLTWPAMQEAVATATVRADLAEAAVRARLPDPAAAEPAQRVVARALAWNRPDLAARAHAAMGQALWDEDPEAGREHFEQATRLGDIAGQPVLQTQLWMTWGLLAQSAWDVQTGNQCLAEARKGLERISASGIRDAVAARVAVLSMVSDFNAGDVDHALASLDEARRLSRALPQQVPAFTEIAVVLGQLEGDLESAARDQSALTEWHRANGLTSATKLARMQAVLAELQFNLGSVEDATRTIDDARTLALDANTPRIQRLEVDSIAARIAAARGAFAHAADILAPHLKAAESADEDSLAGEVTIAWGQSLLLQGRYAEADAAFIRGATLSGFDEPEARGAAILAAAPRAIALRRGGQPERARSTLAPVLQWHEANYPKVLSTRRASLTMAWLDLDAGQAERAREGFARLRTVLNNPMDRAWADVGFASASSQVRGAAGDAERALVERAAATFEQYAEARRYELATCEAWLREHP